MKKKSSRWKNSPAAPATVNGQGKTGIPVCSEKQSCSEKPNGQERPLLPGGTAGDAWWRKIPRSPAALLPALVLVFLGDLFFGGKTFLLRDGYFQIVKPIQYGWQALAHGDFPLWNTLGTGSPFLENFNMFLHPLSAVFGWLPAGWAINVFFLLNLWLMGLAAYFFTRQMRLERMPALVAALAVMFGTFTTAQMEFILCPFALTWVFFNLGILARCFHLELDGRDGLPAGLWRRRRWVAAMAGVFAMHYTLQYHEFFAYPFIAYGLFIVLAAATARSWRMLWSLALFTGAAGVIAILVVLPPLALFWQFLPFTERAGAGVFDSRVDMGSLSVVSLLKAVFPMIGGRPGYPQTFWTPGMFEFSIGSFYTGALALLALPFAFLRRWRERDRTGKLLILWGAGLSVFALLIAMGGNTPVYAWLRDHVPMMQKLRFASKFLLLVITGELLLIGVSVQYILNAPRPLPRRVIIILQAEGAAVALLTALAVAVLANPPLMPALFGLNGKIPDAELAAVLPNLAWSVFFLLLSFGWILWTLLRGAGTGGKSARMAAVTLVALVFLNLLLVSRPALVTGPVNVYDRVPAMAKLPVDSQYRAFSRYNDAHQYLYGDRRADIYEWAIEAGVNTAWYPNRDLDFLCQNGFKTMVFKNWTGLIATQSQAVRDNLLDAASVRWEIGGQPWQQVLWGGADRRLLLNTRATAFPRFMLYTQWQPVPDDKVALRYVATTPNEQLRQRPAVETAALAGGRVSEAPPPDAPAAANAADAAPGGLRLVRETAGHLEFQAGGGARPRLLVISDAWHPGWRAAIDGVEAPIHRANYMFRGVFVPAGEHTVRFDYWPPRLGWYCAASILGLLAIGALLVIPAARKSGK
jgi:hypothetical protein